MKREEAFALLKEHVKQENLLKHSLAVEAIMRSLAERLGENAEEYGLVGLLHDIDFEESDIKNHGLISCEILKGKLPDELLRTIRAHNFENTKEEPKERRDFCLIAGDAVSGLIIACALVMPSKKLEDVKVSSIRKKFKQKEFARNCSREKILYCEKFGMEPEMFFDVALESLKKIHQELGL